MEITIRRQSVGTESAEDTHDVSLSVSSRTRFSDVFHALIRRGYFPNDPAGGAWVLCCCGDDLLAWHTGKHVFYDRFPFGEPCILSVKAWAQPEIFFAWYASPLERARHIFEQFGGQSSQMGHEGFWREYAGCGVPPEVETVWRSALRP